LSYVRFIAGFAYQFVDTAFVVVGCRVTVFGSGLLLYRVRAFEGYLDICRFEEVGDFSDFAAVICEGGPFFVFVISLSVWVLCCVCLFNLVMR
jgi:hypothetical protein